MDEKLAFLILGKNYNFILDSKIEKKSFENVSYFEISNETKERVIFTEEVKRVIFTEEVKRVIFTTDFTYDSNILNLKNFHCSCNENYCWHILKVALFLNL